ncbi:MAG: hypothetical protein AB7G17_14635, partial [Phycisphaerales bacterium]
MNRLEAARTLETTLADLTYVNSRIAALWQSLAEHEGSIAPADTNERVSGGGGGGSPVERAAGRRDPAKQARRRCVSDLAELSLVARNLRARVEFWTETPSGHGAGEGAPGCEVCAWVGRWEAPTSTTAGGNLAQPHLLCRRHRE